MRTPVMVSLAGIVIIVSMLAFVQKRQRPAETAVVEAAPEEQPQELSGVTEVRVDVTRSPVAETRPTVVVQAETNPPATQPDAPPAPASPKSGASLAIEQLVSPMASFGEKQAVWKRLIEAGELDQAIDALKQGALENPASAAYPAALGQAQLQKAGVISRKGGKISEMGILGMQADQCFDTALKLDSANWEAQFFKAIAMSHWPLELNKGEEVIQRLSGLIDQQETLPAQPEFAQTYVFLGDQYKKMGRTEHAAATWQLGANKFPADASLQGRIKGQ